MAQAGKQKRKDKNRVLLKTGEAQRPNGLYMYRWTDAYGRRQSVYAPTLTELREKEQQIEKDKLDNIDAAGKYVTVDHMYSTWMSFKRNVKETTKQTYDSIYKSLIQPKLGCMPVSAIKKSDIRKFYVFLLDEREVSLNTLRNVHAMLGPIFTIAMDDGYIRSNPTSGCLKSSKRSTSKTVGKRFALTLDQQQRFMDYVNNHTSFVRWSPLFTVLFGTGLRIGEALGLRWSAVDMEAKTISVNNTLSYLSIDNGSTKKSEFFLSPPKTHTSKRIIPITREVQDALERELEAQRASGVTCTNHVGGYKDFVFINSRGNLHLARTVNQAIETIVRYYNEQPDVEPLPTFSCHVLRHTFATRMCEAGVNVKAAQSILGHADISMTLNIYTDATEDFKRKEMENFASLMSGVSQMNSYTTAYTNSYTN